MLPCFATHLSVFQRPSTAEPRWSPGKAPCKEKTAPQKGPATTRKKTLEELLLLDDFSREKKINLLSCFWIMGFLFSPFKGKSILYCVFSSLKEKHIKTHKSWDLLPLFWGFRGLGFLFEIRAGSMSDFLGRRSKTKQELCKKTLHRAPQKCRF